MKLMTKMFAGGAGLAAIAAAAPAAAQYYPYYATVRTATAYGYDGLQQHGNGLPAVHRRGPEPAVQSQLDRRDPRRAFSGRTPPAASLRVTQVNPRRSGVTRPRPRQQRPLRLQ